jgi:chemotaxis protein CheX
MTADGVPTTRQLDEIAEQVWSAFIDPAGDRPLTTGETGRYPAQLSAWIGLSGAWHGRVVLGCSAAGARHVAAAMFTAPGADVTTAEVADAVGELANIIGGIVKCLLPAPSRLSLPQVADSRPTNRPAAFELCRTVVRWRGEPFTVSLLQNQSDDAFRVVAV